MTVVYSWAYPTLAVVPNMGAYSDVVVMVRWALEGTENGAVVSREVRPVAVPIDPAQPFVSFHSLTREQVDGWLSDNGAPQLNADGSFAPVTKTEDEILQPYVDAGLDILDVTPPWPKDI